MGSHRRKVSVPTVASRAGGVDSRGALDAFSPGTDDRKISEWGVCGAVPAADVPK